MAISNVPHRRKLHLEPPTSTSSLSTKESSALPSRLLTSPHAVSSPSGAVSTSLEHSFDSTALLLIRRTLCAHRVSPTLPIAELLPRLTSSEAIDLELYAIISVVVRDFIATWYTKITLDGEFLDEIIELVAHISHALESRLATLDLERLLLDELPAVINGHIIAHRTATQHASTSRDVIRIYNALRPHPALSPIPVDTPSREVQRGNERAYRLLLVQDLLRTLLPPADLENDCLRTLVEEILAEAVLGKLVLGKATETCIWWELCAKLCETLYQRRPSRKQTPATVSTEDAAPNTIKSPVRLVDVWSRLQSIISSCFFALGYFLLLLFYAGRGILIAFVTSSSLPSRRPLGPPSPSLSLKNFSPSQDDPSSPSYDQLPTAPKRSKPLSPLITSEILTTISLLLDLPHRMPWLQSSIQLLQWGFLVGPGRIGAADGILDRYITIKHLTPLLTAPITTNTLLLSLHTLRILLTNPTPTPPPTTPSEKRAIKRSAAQAILNLIPPAVSRVWLGTAVVDEQIREVERGVDVFGGVGSFDKHDAHHDDNDDDDDDDDDAEQDELRAGEYMLRSLVFSILDLLLVRLGVRDYGRGRGRGVVDRQSESESESESDLRLGMKGRGESGDGGRGGIGVLHANGSGDGHAQGHASGQVWPSVVADTPLVISGVKDVAVIG